MRTYLDFEKPVADLQGKIQELRSLGTQGDAITVEDEIGRMEARAHDILRVKGNTLYTVSPDEPLKGPCLGGIAARNSRAELIESIVRPGAIVAQGFATNTLATSDGVQHVGFVVREGSTDVVIRDLTGTETSIPKTRITSRAVVEGSVMPQGLADTLSLAELSALLAYLASLPAGAN